MADISIFSTGSREGGMGHIMREIVLGRKLTERGCDVGYVTYNRTAGATRLTNEIGKWDFRFDVTQQSEDAILRHLQVAQPDIFIIDVEHGPMRGFLEEAKKYADKVVVIGGVGFVINDQEAIDELVDLQVFQSIALNEKLYATRNALVGAEYVIIGEDYRAARESYTGGDGILISMGGGDPFGLLPSVFAKLRQAFPNEHITRVYGPSAKLPIKPHWHRRNSTYTVPSPLLATHIAPASLAPLMAEHKVLVTALGMTVYEAMCVGIPTICTAWSRDHEDTAIKLEHLHCITYAGIWSKLNYDTIENKIRTLLGYNSLVRDEEWKFHNQEMRATVDGLGAERVAEAICQLT